MQKDETTEFKATVGELAELLDTLHSDCKSEFGSNCGICNALRHADALLAGGHRGTLATAIAGGNN